MTPTTTSLRSTDAKGQMTTATWGTDHQLLSVKDAATGLGYDTLNRLTQAQKTGLPMQSYQYDDQGRRISKTVGTTSTSYLYNGPLIHFTATAAQYYHRDGLGSVVAVSDASGALNGSSLYDAWGNRIAANGTVPQYGYTGREPDETGLIYSHWQTGTNNGKISH